MITLSDFCFSKRVQEVLDSLQIEEIEERGNSLLVLGKGILFKDALRNLRGVIVTLLEVKEYPLAFEGEFRILIKNPKFRWE